MVCFFIMNFTETFPCRNSPCQHGTCYEGPVSFYCACELGYTGNACDSRKLFHIYCNNDLGISWSGKS